MSDYTYVYIAPNGYRYKITTGSSKTVQELKDFGLETPSGGLWRLQTQEELIDENGNVIQEGVYEDVY